MNAIEAIKKVGRGRDSARPLDRAQAQAIFGQMLDGTIEPLQLGALLMAWRIKGEAAAELAGFLDAAQARIAPIRIESGGDQPPLVVIPSYNGARARANLLPLLALLLREAGARVLVHGVSSDPKRVTTGQIMAALGVPACRDTDEIVRALNADRLAFVTVDTLAPALARLLALRWQMGVRSSGHTIVKMLDPVPSAALRLLSVTHPAYIDAMREYYAAYPSSLLLMRGTEGEAVVRSARPQAIEWLHAGRCETVLDADDRDPPGGEAGLPEASDIGATARWIESALADRERVPAPIEAQAGCIMRAAAASNMPRPALEASLR